MTLLEQIKGARIVGCGGVGFPAYVKPSCTVEYLIVNTVKCEPLLRTDRWLMIHKAERIVTVAGMIGDVVQAGRRYITLRETYSEGIASLETAIKDLGNSVRLYRIKNFYSAGDEQIMVCNITGRTVPPSGIPLDVGAVVSNLTMVYSTLNVTQGQPFIDKCLTITGAVEVPRIVCAFLGMPFTECLSPVGGNPLSSCHVVAEGPMVGKCCDMKEAADLVIIKTISGYIIVVNGTSLVKQYDIPVSVALKQAKMCCIQCSCCTPTSYTHFRAHETPFR